MGTRGIIAFLHNGEIKATYNHFDSYPSALGVTMAAFVAEHRNDMAAVEAKVDALVLVDEDKKPTKAQVARLKQYANTDVGAVFTDDGKIDTSINWYQLLHETQGDPKATLEAGFMIDSSEFALDSLFCEWAYVVNLDTEKLEVYQGFQKKHPTRGLWAGRPTAEEDEESYRDHLVWCHKNNREPYRSEVSEYKAISLLLEIPFRDIPTDPGGIGLLMETIEEQVGRMDPEYLAEGDELATVETLAVAVERVLALVDDAQGG